MITVMLASSKASFLDKPSKKNIRYAHRFLAISLVMILITGIAAYQIRNYHLRKKKKPQLSVMQFLNDGELPDLRSILIGMSFGTVFGFLDVFFICPEIFRSCPDFRYRFSDLVRHPGSILELVNQGGTGNEKQEITKVDFPPHRS